MSTIQTLAVDGFFFVWFASAVPQTHPSTFVILFQSRIINYHQKLQWPEIFCSTHSMDLCIKKWATPILQRSAMCGRAMHDWLLLCRWCLEQLRWCGGCSQPPGSIPWEDGNRTPADQCSGCMWRHQFISGVLMCPDWSPEPQPEGCFGNGWLPLSHHFLTTYRWNVFITSISCHLVMGPTNNHCNSPSKRIDI